LALSPFTPVGALKIDASDRSSIDDCAKIKKLGYIAGKHVNFYGEHFEIVSDPFIEGECIAVRAFSGNDPTIRTLELPVSILAGWGICSKKGPKVNFAGGLLILIDSEEASEAFGRTQRSEQGWY
jgi:hypothetical protein